MSALEGKRVLVTRAAEDNPALAALFSARGAIAVAMPCIELQPPADPAPLEAIFGEIARGEWSPELVALASPHAVARFFAELDRRSLRLQARFAAVGAATMEALQCRAISGVFSPSHGAGATALLAELAPRAKGMRVLVPRAEEGSPELREGLHSAGADVRDVVLYRTVAARAADPRALALLRARQIAAIAFASGSAARGFAGLLGAEAAPLAAACKVACIGQQCAEAARGVGLRVDAVGAGGMPELVEALEAVL